MLQLTYSTKCEHPKSDVGQSRAEWFIADEFAFTLPFTQEMMSDALGLSVPHLDRTLTKLRNEGMIAMSERRVEFIDLKGLQQLAQFQPVRPAQIPVPEECRLD